MALTKITRGVIKANENYDTHNINSTGIVTAVSANFTGNVSIGGTLTYQDVTNIDSVGIITARAGVKVPDNQKVFLGTDSDLEIYHDGSNARIKNTTGQLWLQSDNGIRFVDSDVNESTARFTDNGAVELYYDGTKKFETTSGGVEVSSGNLTMPSNGRVFVGNGGNATNPMFANVSDTNTGIAFPAADTMMFTTGGSERIRITSDGKLGVNATSPGCQTGGIHVVHDNTEGSPTFTGGEVGIFQRNYNSAQTCEIGIIGGSNSSSRINFGDKDDADRGIISYSHNDDSMRFIVSAAERLRIDSDGNVNIGNKDHHSHNGTVDSLQIGHALNLYEDSYTSGTDNYAIWANNAYYRSGGGNYYMRNDEASRIYQQAGEMWFQNAAAGTAENTISFDTKLRITLGGNFHLSSGELKTIAGDKFAQIRGGGVINTTRHATGQFANSAPYSPQAYGYIGDYMHYGCNAVYYLAQTTTGNSGYSSHMFSWYDSGHWSHYGKFVLMCHESNYIGGMAHRYLSGTSVTDIFSIGNNGSVSTTQTLTGSGTHSGQSVYRYDCTVSHTSTYRTMRWYLGVLHGCVLGVTGSGKSQSDCNTYANSNGSLLHLFGVSDSHLTMGPNYRTW